MVKGYASSLTETCYWMNLMRLLFFQLCKKLGRDDSIGFYNCPNLLFAVLNISQPLISICIFVKSRSRRCTERILHTRWTVQRIIRTELSTQIVWGLYFVWVKRKFMISSCMTSMFVIQTRCLSGESSRCYDNAVGVKETLYNMVFHLLLFRLSKPQRNVQQIHARL